MSDIVIYIVGALLLLTNIAMRLHIRQLEARLRALSNPQERLAYLRTLSVKNDKIAAIKALRKQYPELSLIEANQLWQQR